MATYCTLLCLMPDDFTCQEETPGDRSGKGLIILLSSSKLTIVDSFYCLKFQWIFNFKQGYLDIQERMNSQ